MTMARYFFLIEDFDDLNREIGNTSRLIEKAMKDIGDSCDEGADTWHDNFAFEEGQRQSTMWTQRIRELLKIRNNAALVNPPTDTSKVSVGCTVTVLDETKSKEMTFKIGSYINFKDSRDYVSYSAPLAKLVIGAAVGEERKGMIDPYEMILKVMKITK